MIDRPRVFSLNLHAHYACRHSGACCTAGWAIPVEPEKQSLLGGRLLLPDSSGACQFLDRASTLCRVHRDHGERWLPEACVQFPRRALIDDRGVFITLSHFCPTAAALVVRSSEIPAIVEAPPAFPAERRYEGLDGRNAWPPLLRPNVLFDLASYTQWERFVVATFGNPGGATAAAALARLAEAAEGLRAWTPAKGPLREAVEALSSGPGHNGDVETALSLYRRFSNVEAYERVLTFIPEALERPALTAADRGSASDRSKLADAADAAARRYLAAKAFGSWAAYEARGLRTMVAELVLTELVLRVELVRARRTRGHAASDDIMIAAIRATDWLLVHLVDRPQLVAWLGAIER